MEDDKNLLAGSRELNKIVQVKDELDRCDKQFVGAEIGEGTLQHTPS
jgi:hypothetical protein